jgi:hypothetical protein
MQIQVADGFAALDRLKGQSTSRAPITAQQLCRYSRARGDNRCSDSSKLVVVLGIAGNKVSAAFDHRATWVGHP